ncbi:hypothetical protein [Streptomyces sp. NPDC015125]|uniref:hypothetical protein n=1 Tax=Streptomyces sp. NPDC015125 TaxID=3364938 RepID=UPI0036FE9F55
MPPCRLAVPVPVGDRVDQRRMAGIAVLCCGSSSCSPGPLAAFVAFVDAPAAAGHPVGILAYAGPGLASGPDSTAVACVQCRIACATYRGAGRDASVLTASVRAVLPAGNGRRPGGRGGGNRWGHRGGRQGKGAPGASW